MRIVAVRDLMAELSTGLRLERTGVESGTAPEDLDRYSVGKVGHHVCVIDETGKTCWSQRVGNQQRAIEAVIECARGTGVELRWAIDLTGPVAALLITVVLAAGEQVVYVPGRVVSTMTGIFRGEGKTDAEDARVIADAVRMRGDFQPVTAPDELVAELTQLSSYRADLMADGCVGSISCDPCSRRSSQHSKPRSITRPGLR